MHVKQIAGPEFLTHFNEYPAAQLNITGAPGYSSGQVRAALEEVFQQHMPLGMGFDYQGMSFQEQQAAKGVPAWAVFALSLLFVFLILAALYESWSLPFSVLLSTPVAILGAYIALSARALENLGDGTVDVVYLDADHGYEAVRRELSIVRRKIRPDGVIVMNDYTMVDVVGATMAPYGVIQATHEFMVEHGWEMRWLALQSYMYCDVALTRADAGASRSRARRLASAVLRRAGLR